MNAAFTLLLFATGGTIALIGAAFLLGFNNNSLIADDAAAKHFVYVHAPDSEPHQVALSVDRKSALVLSKTNDLFLVIMMGDGPVVRTLRPSDIVTCAVGRVEINVHDLGFPKRDLCADDRTLRSIMGAFNRNLPS